MIRLERTRNSPSLSGSARAIGVAALLSAALHLIAIAALSGIFLYPPAEKQGVAPMQAVIVALPTPRLVAEPSQSAPVPRKSAQRTRKAPTTPVILITEPETVGPPVVISSADQPARKIESRRAGSGESPPEPPSLAAASETASISASKPTVQSASAPPEAQPPRRIRLEYQLRSSLVDGRAEYLWHADPATRRYSIEGSMEADGFFASMFAGRFEQQSTGEIVEGRLRPERFSLRRGESPAEIARFDWDSRRVEHQRIRGEHIQPLQGNAQDLQSFIFQFGYEFSRPVPPEHVSFAITNARKMETYEFRVMGKERLKLPFGEVDTIHLVRTAQDPGDAYEAWLSPAHRYLPVKIRFMLSGRFPVDQLLTRIDIEP